MSTLMQRRQALMDADPELVNDETELVRLLGEDDGADALDVIRRLVRATITLNLRAIEADHLMERLSARKARYDRRASYLRDTILAAMQALELDRLPMVDATVSRAKVSAVPPGGKPTSRWIGRDG